MSTEIKRRRISDFPIGAPENVELFARTSKGTNVRVRYDVKQQVGTSETSVMSQSAVTAELAKRDAALKSKKGNTIALGRSIKYGNTIVASDATITDTIENIAQRIENIALIEIPDGSITESKLSDDVRQKLNHDNGYWFEVVGEAAATQTTNNTAQVVYSRSLTK